MAFVVPCLSVVGVEHDLSTTSTRACGKTLSDNLSGCEGLLVEYGVKEFVKFLRFATKDSGLFVDFAFVEEVNSDFHHCGTRTFAVTGLEEPKFAFLNGKFHILHVAVVVFEFLLDGVELSVNFRHCFFHRRILGHAVGFADAGAFCPALRTDFGDLLRCTDTCHNVFTLSIYEIFAVEEVFAVGGVAAEAYACSRSVAHVAEYHSHHADSRAPFIRYSFHLTIEDSTFVHPTAEHCADGAPKLFDRIVGEVFAGAFFDGGLEENDEFFEFVNAKVLVKFHAAFGFNFFDNFFERVDVGFVNGLHFEHHVAVHLYEAAIGVVNEVGVVGFLHHTFGNFVVQTEVEDSVHHTGHRSAGSGTNRH